tara:strand:- start:94 stop:297 length:204 start_codon:yes stop_codon:yes gene_type:complete
MGNMSYCRFENTLADMQDCLNALQNGLDAEELSEYEIDALAEFADVARQIARFEGNIQNVIEQYEQG